jgi:hypothetical protein
VFAKELRRAREEIYRLVCQHENDLKMIDALHQQLEKEALYRQVTHAGCYAAQKIINPFSSCRP